MQVPCQVHASTLSGVHAGTLSRPCKYLIRCLTKSCKVLVQFMQVPSKKFLSHPAGTLSRPCKYLVRCPCRYLVTSMQVPCHVHAGTLSRPCRYLVTSMQVPCHVHAGTLSRPCRYLVTSMQVPCHIHASIYLGAEHFLKLICNSIKMLYR